MSTPSFRARRSCVRGSRRRPRLRRAGEIGSVKVSFSQARPVTTVTTRRLGDEGRDDARVDAIRKGLEKRFADQPRWELREISAGFDRAGRKS